MKKLFLLLTLAGLVVLAPFQGMSFAQVVEVETEVAEPDTMEEPEQVVKLEELIIEIEPLKVFIVPRMEAELPPIDFAGIFRSEFLQPSPEFFILKPEDMEPIKTSKDRKIFAKNRK